MRTARPRRTSTALRSGGPTATESAARNSAETGWSRPAALTRRLASAASQLDPGAGQRIEARPVDAHPAGEPLQLVGERHRTRAARRRAPGDSHPGLEQLRGLLTQVRVGLDQ